MTIKANPEARPGCPTTTATAPRPSLTAPSDQSDHHSPEVITMLYESSDIPQRVNNQPVLAFAPVLSYLPSQATAPSGTLARAITQSGPQHFTVYSLAWQPDSGTWFQDGTRLCANYALALRYLTEPKVRHGEFANTI